MLSLVVTCYQCEAELANFFHWLTPVVKKFRKVVVVDDCSSDATSVLLKKYAREFSNLEVLIRGENSGRPSLPRNEGLALVADEDRVVFLDIDDRLPYEYVDFLSTVDADDCFSGVKFVCDPHKFDANVHIPIFRARIINKRSLAYKNQIVFSGASLPARFAKRYLFSNRPLEDWLYWKALAASDTIRFVRFRGVPIAYNGALSLSPRKWKQLGRVYNHVGILGMVCYFLHTVRLKWEERAAQRGFILDNKS